MAQDWKQRAKPVASGNWRSKAKPVDMNSVSLPTENVRTPYVSVADRAIAKNLAQSPEKQAEFLKQKYPDLDVKVMNNEVVVKKPGETNYKMLDPTALEAEDITDLGDVVAGGITSAIGTGLGALGGTLAAPGVGSVAGGIAGASAANAATEALRQKLGQALGIPQEVSGADVATSALLGGASTALLGTGPAMKSAVDQLVKARGVTPEVAKQMLESSGAIASTYKNLPAKFGEYWFGAPADVIKKYADDTESIDAIAKGSKTDFTQNLVNKIRQGFNQEKSRVGGELSDAIVKSGKQVDVDPIMSSYAQHIAKLENEFKAMPNAINKSKLDSAKQEFATIFNDVASNVEGAKIPTKMTPMQAWDMQDVFKEYGDLTRIGGGVNSRFKSQATEAEKELSNQALSAYQFLNKQLDDATSGVSQGLKDEYSQLKGIQENISPYLKSDQSAYTTFKNADSAAKTAFRESIEKLGKKTGQDFTEDMTRLQAAEYFGSNALTPKSVGGMTSTSRTLPSAAVGGLLGSVALGSAMPYGHLVGAGLGAGAGNFLASPLVLKGLIKGSAPIRQGVNAVSPYLFNASPVLRETINQTPWSQF